MPKSTQPRSLKYRELVARLARFGVQAMHNRGKGSETILIRPTVPGECRGPQYTVKNHGLGTEISKPVIAAALRVLNIDPDQFWEGE